MSDRFASDCILVVDDEADFARGLARLIQKGFPASQVLVRPTGEAALELLAERPCSLMLTDLHMPGINGMELLDKALALEPELSVVLLTGFGTIETAVSALKSGAYDFLTKPIDQDALYRVVAKGLERGNLLRENRQLREAVSAGTQGRPEIIGESPAMRQLREEIEAVAGTDYTVLITGESGSGKELVARTIHRLSRRGAQPLVSVNCTAVPENILESELFGHVKGAFTGAVKSRQGLFLEADGSSLHLDEIGDLPVHIQPKLLRALQEREIRHVGGSQSFKVDVRILASTNQHLEARIGSGNFREDLYYRLNVLTIRVPPLRERARDVPLLAMHFLGQCCRELEMEEKTITPDALDHLSSRPWPGNVRELLNFVRRLAVFCNGPVITRSQVTLLDSPTRMPVAAATTVESYRDAKERFLDDFTRTYVERLLEQVEGNMSRAARLSGLERASLQKIVRRMGIDATRYREKGGA